MNDALRLGRVINSQGGLIRARLESSKPDQGDTVFKRTVALPPDTSLDSLIHRWNPGVSELDLEEMLLLACRWNRLRSPQAAKAGQLLLIPTVIPIGQEPREPGTKTAPAPDPEAAHKPPSSLSLRASAVSALLEQRARAASSGEDEGKKR